MEVKCSVKNEEQTASFTEAWNELKSSPKELFLIFILKFLESYSYFAIIYTLIIFLFDEFKYSDEQAGWSYGIFGMCTSLYGFLFGGYLIDNMGVKYSLTLGFSILLIRRLLLVFCSQHIYILLIIYTILPVGTCLGIPVMQIGIRRFTNKKSRSLAYSIFYAMMNISAIFSGSAIDFFRKHLSVNQDYKIPVIHVELTAYRALFLSGACTTLLSLLLAIILLKDKRDDYDFNGSNLTLLGSNEEVENLLQNGRRLTPQTVKINKIPGPFKTIKEVTSQNSFLKFLWLIILLMGVRIVYRHLDATFPKYMIREFGKDVLYGSIIAINPFLIVILIPIFAPLSYQFSAYSQITFGAFITSLSPFFLVGEPHLWCLCTVCGNALDRGGSLVPKTL